MPFTPSHIAAVLPFAKTPLLPAALAIGAMTPDLFYYLPVDVSRSFSHSWLGVVTVDLACGIALAVLWQFFFRAPLVDFMPLWVRQRIQPSEWMPPGRLRWLRLAGLLVASVLLGCVTHVLWDAATHDGPFVHLVPVLYDQFGPLRLFKWLQHASSVGGVIAVALFVLWWRRSTHPGDAAPTHLTKRTRIAGWVVVLGVGLVIAVYLWFRGIFAHHTPPLDNALIFYIVVAGLAAAGLATFLTCVVWWAKRPKTE